MAHQTARIVAALPILAVAAAAASSQLVGTWGGKMNDLPAVELVIENNNGQVSGSIGFYFQSRADDGKWHVGEKMTVPLLSPKLDGKVLTFETIHHKKHGSPELGPNNKYRITFVGPNEARLQIMNSQRREDGASGFKLTRR